MEAIKRAGRPGLPILNLISTLKQNKYQECFDTAPVKPHDSYVRLYNAVKEELAGLGLPLD